MVGAMLLTSPFQSNGIGDLWDSRGAVEPALQEDGLAGVAVHDGLVVALLGLADGLEQGVGSQGVGCGQGLGPQVAVHADRDRSQEVHGFLQQLDGRSGAAVHADIKELDGHGSIRDVVPAPVVGPIDGFGLILGEILYITGEGQLRVSTIPPIQVALAVLAFVAPVSKSKLVLDNRPDVPLTASAMFMVTAPAADVVRLIEPVVV